MKILNKYEESASALRSLINFHKMRFCPHFDERHCAAGTIMCYEKGKCPRATFENDVYLEALEMSLQLVNEKINQV